jgi:hypothetical protein
MQTDHSHTYPTDKKVLTYLPENVMLGGSGGCNKSEARVASVFRPHKLP